MDHSSSIINIDKADIFKFDLLARYLGLANSFNFWNITFNLKAFNYSIFLEFWMDDGIKSAESDEDFKVPHVTCFNRNLF